jgi:hypothetical protein
MRLLTGAAVLGLVALVACGDSKPEVADTSALPDNTIKALPGDTAGLDSTVPAPNPATPESAGTQAGSPPVIGEGRRDGPPTSRDPMPPLTGETSKQGGTMPVYRDSASGPRMEVDSKGRVTPIKK